MKKQILLSILVVSTVVALIGGATLAYVNDVEISAGNTFTAGEVDLKIDYDCYYNKLVDGKTNCPSWTPNDLIIEKFFNFNDVKPGDYGEGTISLNVDNDAWICATVYNLESKENGCNEPEQKAEPNCAINDVGELQDNLYFTIWLDKNCNNVFEDGEKILVKNHKAEAIYWPIADSTTGTGPLLAGKNCIGVNWYVLSSVGNIIQSDSLKGDIKFWAEQARHNENFKCKRIERYPVTGNAYIGYEDWPNGDFDYNDFGMTFAAEETYNQDWNLAEVKMDFKAVIYDSGADHYVHINRPFVGTYTYTVTRGSSYAGEIAAGTYIGSGTLDVVLYNTGKYAWPQKHINEPVTIDVVLNNPELNPKLVLTPPRSMVNNGYTIIDVDPFMANYDPWLHDYAGVSGTFHITDIEHVTGVTGAHPQVLDTRFVGMNLPHILVVPHTDWIPPFEDTSISRPAGQYTNPGGDLGPYNGFYDYYWTNSTSNWHDTITNSYVGLGGISW